MAVTAVGTPGAVQIQSASNTGSIAGVFSGTQPRTAGDLLVACVTAWGSTSAGTISTPSGWTASATEVSASGRNRVAIYTKVAAGSDTAPTFTCTLAGTASLSRMSCELYELAGQDGTTPVITTGAATNVGTTLSIVTSGNVPSAGCFGVDCVNVAVSAAGTLTYTAGSGWTSTFDQGAVSARSHSASATISSPTSGSTLTDAPSYSGGSNSDFTGVTIVVQPPSGTPVSGSDTAAGTDTASMGASITGADTAAGTDTASVTSAAISAADTATGTDTASVTSAAISAADTAAGTDTGSAGQLISAADTAAGADTASVTSATVSAADTAAGADTASVTHATVSAADTATGTDTATVATGSNAVSDGDTATGTDTASVQAFTSFPQSVLKLLVELNVGGVWTDITSYVYQRSPISITRGRPDESSTVNPSVCSLTLNNRDGRFSSRNPLGAYFGQIGRNSQLRISAQDNWQAPYNLAFRFWGEISAWPQGWDPTGTDIYVMITASGVLRRFGQGAIIGAALDRFYSRLSDNTVPVGWWPAGDGSGATSIASGLAGGLAMQFTGTPSLAANSDFAACTAIPTLGGSTWTGQIPTSGSGNTEGLFLVSSHGSGNFIGPAGITEVNVSMWAAGGGGIGGYAGSNNGLSTGVGGPGGGGGEWGGALNIPSTPAASHAYSVGQGGFGSAPGDHAASTGGNTTLAINSTTYTVHGGTGTGGPLSITPDSGGTNIAAVAWNAGVGGSGSNMPLHENGGFGSANDDTSGPGSEAGLGGGASGGPTSSGGFPAALTQTGADAVPGGGPGGDGGDDTPTSGNSPVSGPGGGGGGGGASASGQDSGAAGHDGMLKITWIIPGSGGFTPDSNVMRFLLEAAQGDADGGVICRALTFGDIAQLDVMYRAGAAVLSTTVSGTITSLPVNALPAAIPAGTVTLWSQSGSQLFTTTGASSGATSIPVSSLLVANTTESGDAITIGITQPGYLELAGYDAVGVTLFDSGPKPFAANGALLMVSAELTPDGAGNVDWLLTALDTVTGSIVASFTGSVSSAAIGQVSTVIVNPGGALTGAAVGEITIQYDSVSLASMALPAAAYAGETAAARLTRFGGEEGITVVIVGDGTTSALMGPQAAGSQVLDVLQQCEDADRGLLFEPRDTFGLGYRCRTSLYNQSPAVTLNYTSAQVMDPLLPTDDDLLTVNDVTVSRDNGSSVTTALQAGTMSIQDPPAGVGDYTFSLTAVVDSDAQLADLAGWIVHVGTVDEMRYPSVNNALERTEAQAVFTDSVYCDIGDYLAISNPPAWQPPGTIRQLVYGLNETLNAFTWRIEANCVPESPYEVAVAGTTWHVDTDGSSLHGNISGAATTLQADTPAGNALWTLTDVPFDIQCGGERMTVTAVTGSSSPQTFTVTRGVNGVTLAISAGTPISLFYPPVVAL